MRARNRPLERSLDRHGTPGELARPLEQHARPPDELLDNLRLRLGQLASNHPSAPGDRPDSARYSDDGHVHRDDEASPGPVSRRRGGEFPGDGARSDSREPNDLQPDRLRPDHLGPDQLGPDQLGPDHLGPGHLEADDGDRPGGGVAGNPGLEAVRSAVTAVAGGLGVLATMELPGRARHSDPYRPWFMAGEPGSPWWSSALY